MIFKQLFNSGLCRYVYSPTKRYANSSARTFATINGLVVDSVEYFECCKKQRLSSFPYNGVEHLYCGSCKLHIYNGKKYNKSEWELFIEVLD